MRRVARVVAVLTLAAACGDDGGSTATPEEVDDRFELIVFMEPSATQAQIDAMAQTIEADERIEDHEFVDQEGALADFRELFSDDRELLESVTADILPSSFELQLDPDLIEEVTEDLEGEPGVRELATPPTEEELRQREQDPLSTIDTDEPLVIVFLHPGSSRAELQRVHDELAASAVPTDVELVDQDQAFEDFTDLFEEDPSVDEVTPELLPPSVEVYGELASALEVLALACAYTADDVVREVIPQRPLTCPSA